MQSLPLCSSCLFSMLLNEDIVDIEKPDGIYSKYAWIINGALLDFWYWLNYNIIVSSVDILKLQESLFSHTLILM